MQYDIEIAVNRAYGVEVLKHQRARFGGRMSSASAEGVLHAQRRVPAWSGSSPMIPAQGRGRGRSDGSAPHERVVRLPDHGRLGAWLRNRSKDVFMTTTSIDEGKLEAFVVR